MTDKLPTPQEVLDIAQEIADRVTFTEHADDELCAEFGCEISVAARMLWEARNVPNKK